MQQPLRTSSELQKLKLKHCFNWIDDDQAALASVHSSVKCGMYLASQRQQHQQQQMTAITGFTAISQQQQDEQQGTFELSKFTQLLLCFHAVFDRYDMLCLEGIARALNIFKGRLEAPQYRLADMKGEIPS